MQYFQENNVAALYLEIENVEIKDWEKVLG